VSATPLNILLFSPLLLQKLATANETKENIEDVLFCLACYCVDFVLHRITRRFHIYFSICKESFSTGAGVESCCSYVYELRLEAKVPVTGMFQPPSLVPCCRRSWKLQLVVSVSSSPPMWHNIECLFLCRDRRKMRRVVEKCVLEILDGSDAGGVD
jgi:hypothetical protein